MRESEHDDPEPMPIREPVAPGKEEKNRSGGGRREKRRSNPVTGRCRERAEQRRAGQQEEHRAARQRPERRPQPDGESQSQCEAGPQIGWKAPSAEQQLPGYFDGFFHTVFVFASKI